MVRGENKTLGEFKEKKINKVIKNPEDKIIKILTKMNKPMSKTEIANKLKWHPGTASKYVDILVASGKISIEKFGNIHLVTLKPMVVEK